MKQNTSKSGASREMRMQLLAEFLGAKQQCLAGDVFFECFFFLGCVCVLCVFFLKVCFN